MGVQCDREAGWRIRGWILGGGIDKQGIGRVWTG